MKHEGTIMDATSKLNPKKGSFNGLRINLRDDHLKKLCKSMGIALEYKDRRPVILAYTIKRGIPIIIADYAFETCSQEIAKAIIGYYILYPGSKEYYKLIQDYARKMMGQERYMIKPADERFSNFFEKFLERLRHGQRKRHRLLEAEILSIVQKEFSGEVSVIKPGEAIKSTGSDVLELEIEIDYICI